MSGKEFLALTWTWDELSQHAGVQRRLEADVDAVLEECRPEYSDLERFRFTRLVIEEASRPIRPRGVLPTGDVDATRAESSRPTEG